MTETFGKARCTRNLKKPIDISSSLDSSSSINNKEENNRKEGDLIDKDK